MTGDSSRSRQTNPAIDGAMRRVATAKTGSLPELISIPQFHAVTGHHPYPWQRRLYRRFLKGEVPEAVDIPTGLGKTMSVLLALLARLVNPDLPRRVVYIVDRRALVDQAAETIHAWIERIRTLPELACASTSSGSWPASSSAPRRRSATGCARRTATSDVVRTG